MEKMPGHESELAGHVFNTSIWKVEVSIWKFKVSLAHVVSGKSVIHSETLCQQNRK